jgi:hypothetical protein
MRKEGAATLASGGFFDSLVRLPKAPLGPLRARPSAMSGRRMAQEIDENILNV